MKKIIMNILYAILGVAIGILAAHIRGSRVIGYVLYILIAEVFVFSVKVVYLDTILKQIFCIVLGFIFCYYIAAFLQWLVAWVLLLFKGVRWLLGFKVFQIVAFLLAVGLLYLILEPLTRKRKK